MAEDNRTEQPTSKKRQDARDKGQVAKSRDVVQVSALTVSFVMLGRWGGHAMGLLQGELSNALGHVGDSPLRTLGPGDLTQLVLRCGGVLALAVAPLGLAAVLAVVASSVMQTGLMFTTETLTIDLSKLSPAKGIKRFGGMGGYDLGKMAALLVMLGAISRWAVEDIVRDMPRLTHIGMLAVARVGWESIDKFLRRTMLILAVVAAADFAMQRYRVTKSLKMTKDEVKDEMKNQEVSPQVKGRIRKIQREMHRKRMLTNAKRATVVVTNPTHFAVALEYNRATMAAPRVVAKGQGILAQRIKQVAREAGVPLIEQVALARALYKTAEVGETIPGELFEAVAEVLAYLIRLKQLVL